MTCRWRIVLGGRELSCPFVGAHEVHKYRDADGVTHRFMFVDYPPGSICHSDRMDEV